MYTLRFHVGDIPKTSFIKHPFQTAAGAMACSSSFDFPTQSVFAINIHTQTRTVHTHIITRVYRKPYAPRYVFPYIIIDIIRTFIMCTNIHMYYTVMDQDRV